jgi:hypothetical protein
LPHHGLLADDHALPKYDSLRDDELFFVQRYRD